MNESEILDQHPEGTHPAGERVIEKVAHQLDIELPKTKLPVPVKIIALLMVAGGLSVLGTLLVDVLVSGTDLRIRLVRVVLAVVIGVIGYGLIRRRRSALWALSGVVLGGAWFNPVSAIVSFPLLGYLMSIRRFLHPSMIEGCFLRRQRTRTGS